MRISDLSFAYNVARGKPHREALFLLQQHETYEMQYMAGKSKEAFTKSLHNILAQMAVWV